MGSRPFGRRLLYRSCPLIHSPCLGEQEPDEVGGVLRCSETPGRLLSDPAGPDLISHPAGVNRSRVDDVGSNTRFGEFMGRCKHQPIEASLGDAVGKVPDGVVAGQRDDRSAGRRQLPCELGDQQLSGPHVDRVVAIEALDRGVEDAGVHRLRM